MLGEPILVESGGMGSVAQGQIIDLEVMPSPAWKPGPQGLEQDRPADPCPPKYDRLFWVTSDG
jgi:hypothetical protein